MAACIPAETRRLLDLGCGTGLELDEIFPLFPDLPVTGVDLTGAMLDCLAAKHPGRDLTLYCGDYFTVPFEPEAYDTAVSFQTMHHFAHEEKRRLYKKIHDAIKPGGVYIECDYMARDQDQEDRLFAENARIRSALGIAPGAFYHFDTPCTVENQTAILKSAGFGEVEELWRSGFTVMLRAVRKK